MVSPDSASKLRSPPGQVGSQRFSPPPVAPRIIGVVLVNHNRVRGLSPAPDIRVHPEEAHTQIEESFFPDNVNISMPCINICNSLKPRNEGSLMTQTLFTQCLHHLTFCKNANSALPFLFGAWGWSPRPQPEPDWLRPV